MKLVELHGGSKILWVQCDLKAGITQVTCVQHLHSDTTKFAKKKKKNEVFSQKNKTEAMTDK